jgi:hypothetical protein
VHPRTYAYANMNVSGCRDIINALIRQSLIPGEYIH